MVALLQFAFVLLLAGAPALLLAAVARRAASLRRATVPAATPRSRLR